jgi:hypothetical protein
MKTMHRRIGEDPGFRTRFANEVEVVRKIASPGWPW